MREVVQLVRTIRHAHRHIGRAWGLGRILQGQSWARQICAKRDAAQAAVSVAAIVEKGPAERGPQKWQAHRKTKLLVQHQQSLASYGKPADGVSRTGLIESESA